ncbi:MAG: DUF4906 domain-containing protein [Bacteroidales bacterium]|nr:DUF4906 domain-containing protein [Bacteroidales bacterium]
MEKVKNVICWLPVVLTMFAWSCSDEVTVDLRPGDDVEGTMELTFSSGIAVEENVWTKGRDAVLAEEEKIIGAALAIYDGNGVLVHQERVEGEFTGFTEAVRLNKERVYSCYVVTGYIAGVIEFPGSEDELASLTIENTSKNSGGEYDMTEVLRVYGPDRAGSTGKMTPERLDASDGTADGKVSVPISSLWAKVYVTFDASAVKRVEVGLESGGSQSCGAAMGSRIFAPFSEEGAVNVSDKFSILPVETRTSGGGGRSVSADTPFVFYVPENMLGNLLEGNSDADKKTPSSVRDRHGEAMGKAAERSAVEIISPACTDWGENGYITYRFCLGDNTTSNFDIRRNTKYNVVVTATENGFAIKDWKAFLDVPDGRSLSLQPVSPPEELPGAPYQEVNVTGDFYLIPSYVLSEEERTVDDFEKSPGWKLSESTLRQLEELDISYLLLPELDFGDGTASVVLEFHPAHELSSGQAFPVTIETHDGMHSSTVTVQVKADGSVITEWERRPEYIAQQGVIRKAVVSGSVKKVRYSVPEEYKDYIEVDDSAGDGSCIVRTKKKGEAFVSYTGTTEQGAAVCTGKIPVQIKAPILLAGTTVCEVSPDGTASPLAPYYVTESGQVMTVAGSDGAGYGNSFAPSLYAALLSPRVSLQEGPATAYLGSSGNSVYVSRLNSGDQNIVSLFGKSWQDGIKVSAASAPDIVPVYCGLKIKSPIGHEGEDNKLGTIDNHVLTGHASVHSQGVAVNKGRTATLPGLKLEYGVSLSNLSIDDFEDISFTPKADGSLAVTGKSSYSALSVGRNIVNARVHNTRSGEWLSFPAGYLEVYLHTVPLATIDLDKMRPEVSTDIAGAGICPAFGSLRNALFEDEAAVRCNFANGSFYNLGKGYWNYLDEFDEMGNQFTAPNQSGMLTVFCDVNWPGMAKLGETAYTISIGSIEASYGKYSSLSSFLAWNEKAPLLMDYSGLTCLQKSPFNSGMYHYTYDSQTDAFGFSYYVIDYVSVPDWKQ